MRRNFTRGLMAGAIALAGLGASQPALASAKSVDNNAVTVNSNSKATTVRKEKKGAIKVDPYTGGLDFANTLGSVYGLSPKEYGLRFGNGKSKKGKTNYLRMSHNAKVARR